MKSKKIIIAGLLIIGILSISIFTMLGENTTDPLSYKKVKDQAVENNLDYKVVLEQVDLAKLNLDEAKKNKNTGSGIELRLNTSYEPLIAEISYQQALLDSENKLNELIARASRLYFENDILNNTLVQREKDLQVVKNKLLKVQREFELGMAKESAVKSAEKDVKVSELAYNQTLLNARKNEMDLNILMNYDVGNQVILKDDIVPVEKIKVEDIEEAVNLGLAHNRDLKLLRDELEAVKEKEDIYEDYKSSKADLYEDAKEATEWKELEVQQKIASLEYEIRSMYNTVLNNETDQVIAKLSLEIAQKEFDEAEKRYELDLITEDEKVMAESKLISAELGVTQAKLTYYLSVVEYNQMVE